MRGLRGGELERVRLLGDDVLDGQAVAAVQRELVVRVQDQRNRKSVDMTVSNAKGLAMRRR